MTELALTGAELDPRAAERPPLLRRWLDALLPVLAILVLLIAAWYAFAIYMNLHSLDVQHQDIDPAGWKRASQMEKIRQALADSHPLVPTVAQTVGDLLDR